MGWELVVGVCVCVGFVCLFSPKEKRRRVFFFFFREVC